MSLEARFLLLAFVLILGLVFAYFILKRISQREIQGPSGPGPIRLLSTYRLGPGRAISLVRIPGAVLVLGITAQDMRLLSEIRDEERIREIEEETRAQGPFGRRLSLFSKRQED